MRVGRGDRIFCRRVSLIFHSSPSTLPPWGAIEARRESIADRFATMLSPPLEATRQFLDNLCVDDVAPDSSIDASRLHAGLTLSRENTATPSELPTEAPPSISSGPGTPIWRASSATSDSTGYRFQRKRHIGRGGQGDVWEAVQGSLGRRVALKVMNNNLREELASDDGRASAMLTRSFQQEAFITAVLDHPNIVPIYDIAEAEEGSLALAMKLVRGTTWRDLLVADQILPFHQRLHRHLTIMLDVSQAVAFAHSRGVIHRDLKPSQVMVGEFGEVYLMDWGLACLFRDQDHAGSEAFFIDSKNPVPISSASNPAGTPCYMAPEQTLATPERLGPWTDVYLLGGILYHILTDSPPHDASDARRAMHSAATGIVEPPQDRIGDKRQIPPELARIAMKALAADPWQRHGSVKELIDELNGFLIGFGRRAESLALTEEVTATLVQERLSYRQLANCDIQVEKARLLYPENPFADPLHRQVLKRLAEVALSNSELVLARENAEALPASAERDQLLDQVRHAAAEKSRHERQRRMGLVMSSLLVAALMIVLLWKVDTAQRPGPVETPAGTVAGEP